MVTHICNPETGVEELRQEDCCKFKDSLSYSTRPSLKIERWLLFTKTLRSVLLIVPTRRSPGGSHSLQSSPVQTQKGGSVHSPEHRTMRG